MFVYIYTRYIQGTQDTQHTLTYHYQHPPTPLVTFGDFKVAAGPVGG